MIFKVPSNLNHSMNHETGTMAMVRCLTGTISYIDDKTLLTKARQDVERKSSAKT